MPDIILLRLVIESDLPIFFEQQLDPEATMMAAFSSRDKEAFDAHWERVMADLDVILRIIEAVRKWTNSS